MRDYQRPSHGSCRSGRSSAAASWASSSTARPPRSSCRASGTSQQRLSRELEKLAIALHPATKAGRGGRGAAGRGDTAPQAYDLADAVVAGDLRATLALAEELSRRRARRAARVPGRPAAARGASRRGAARVGHARAEGGRGARRAALAPKKTIARPRRPTARTLEHAIEVFADLEVDLRGGGELQLDEDTAFSLALARAGRAERPAAGAQDRLTPCRRRGTTTPSARSSSRCARAWSPGRPRGPPGPARGRSRTASSRRTGRRRCRSAGR